MKLLFSLIFTLFYIQKSLSLFNYKLYTKGIEKLFEGDSDKDYGDDIQRKFEYSKKSDGYCMMGKYAPELPTHNGKLCGATENAGYKLEFLWADNNTASWEF